MLATFSVTHVSPVASVRPLTRLLDRSIPQCDDSNRIRRGEMCGVQRGGSVRFVYPEIGSRQVATYQVLRRASDVLPLNAHSVASPSWYSACCLMHRRRNGPGNRRRLSV